MMDFTSSGQIKGYGRNKQVWIPNKDEKLVEYLVMCFMEAKV